jgi:hypothetical protein
MERLRTDRCGVGHSGGMLRRHTRPLVSSLYRTAFDRKNLSANSRAPLTTSARGVAPRNLPAPHKRSPAARDDSAAVPWG